MTLLYEVVSAIAAAIVFIAWIHPATFKALLDKDSSFPSLGRQGQFTAMIVSTWAMVTTVLNGVMSEWLFAGYMFAWAGAQFSSAYLKIKASAQETK